MEKKIHTVIFDLDGTLCDSAVLTMAAFESIVPAHGLKMPSEASIRRTTGYPNPEFYHILFPDSPKDLITGMGQMVEQEELRITQQVSGRLIFPGCRDLLAILKQRGISMKIASTGDERHVYSVINETGIGDFFETVSCGQSDKTEMLKKLTEKGDRSCYLMVGDMKKDYEAARKNNIRSVGACYGYCRRDLSDFDHYIDTPLELLDILKLYGG